MKTFNQFVVEKVDLPALGDSDGLPKPIIKSKAASALSGSDEQIGMLYDINRMLYELIARHPSKIRKLIHYALKSGVFRTDSYFEDDLRQILSNLSKLRRPAATASQKMKDPLDNMVKSSEADRPGDMGEN